MRCYAAALVGATVSFVLLTRANPILQYPFHPDDFDLLTLSVATLGMPAVRPVSRFLMALLADLGRHAFYVTLAALVVLYLVLSVRLVARVLAVRLSARELASACAVVGGAYFLFEAAPETVRYTGHMTNVLSTVFGMLAALAVWRGRRRGVWCDLASVVACALSVYAKEDCAPFVLLVAGARVGGQWRRRGACHAARSAGLLGALLAVSGSAFLYHRWVIASPFLSGAGPYELSFRPLDFARNAVRLLLVSRHAAFVLACFTAATVATLVLRSVRAERVALLWGSIGALVVPYALLTKHVYPLYAYNWLPPMLAGVVVMGLACARRVERRALQRLLPVAGALALAGLYVVSTPARNEAAARLTRHQHESRAVVEAVVRHRQALAGAPLVVLTGLDVPRHPWMFGDGRFMNELLGHDVRWLLVVEPGSFADWVYAEFARPRDNRGVAVVSSTCLPMLATAPELRFQADLTARLIAARPAPAVPEAIRIELGAVERAPLLCQGWSAPEGPDGRRVRWVEGAEALLLVALPRGTDLALRVRAWAAPGDRSRRMLLLLDGALATAVDVDARGRPVDIVVPREVVCGAVSTISVRVDPAPEEGAGARGIALEWIEVAPLAAVVPE